MKPLDADYAIQLMQEWETEARCAWDRADNSSTEEGAIRNREWHDECLDRAYKYSLIAQVLNRTQEAR